MVTYLACRVLQRELSDLGQSDRVTYFEPLCHRLRASQFTEYVASLVQGHAALLCGDCGGLAEVARDAGVPIPHYDDCIQMLLPGVDREPNTFYLTDGWVEHFDVIFGLDRLSAQAKNSVTRTIFAGIRKVVFVSTGSNREGEMRARSMAEAIGCDFASVRGSLTGLSRVLEELVE